MKFMTISCAMVLAGLASTVDFRLHPGYQNCAGGYVQCTNQPANTCCTTNPASTGFYSAGIILSPPIVAYFWKPSGAVAGCGQAIIAGSPGQRITTSSYCVTSFGTADGRSTGATWQPTSKKRGEKALCKGSVRADIAVLRDGHKFDTGTSTPDIDAQKIFALVQTNATIHQIPAELAKYVVHDGKFAARAAEIASTW